MGQHTGNIQIPSSVPPSDRALAQQMLGYMQRWRDRHGTVPSLARDAARYGDTVGHDAWLDDENHWVWDLARKVIQGA